MEGRDDLRHVAVCPVNWADDGPVMTAIVHCDPVVRGPDVAQAASKNHRSTTLTSPGGWSRIYLSEWQRLPLVYGA